MGVYILIYVILYVGSSQIPLPLSYTEKRKTPIMQLLMECSKYPNIEFVLSKHKETCKQ